MSHLDVPRFPRGFVLSDRHVEPPPTFVPGPLLDHFWVHPWTNVEVAGNHELLVIILGHCIPTVPGHSEDPAKELLRALRRGVDVFLDSLSTYSGRHAVIFGEPGNLAVVNDATGMRSVFYAIGSSVVASHALLVEQALGGTIERSQLPFRYGYPGNRTPYARTRILTPNTYYWMTAGVVRRFWPLLEPTPQTVDEAAAALLEASTTALQMMSRNKRIEVTLTAGLDSRTILAVAMHAGVPFRTYTYGNKYSTKVDRLIAEHLAYIHQLEHTVISERYDVPLVEKSLDVSHYSLHHPAWVGPLMRYFESQEDVAVLGNALEIGRSNYGPQRKNNVPPPLTAKTMAELHHRKLGEPAFKEIEQYGETRFWEEAEAAFQGFIEDTGYNLVVGLLDPFDQFYWEHRMPTWQGVAMGERDFYGVPFIPYNSRRVFATMLGTPSESRHEDAVALRMIEMVDPKLLDFPVNPKTWSRAKAVHWGLLPTEATVTAD